MLFSPRFRAMEARVSDPEFFGGSAKPQPEESEPHGPPRPAIFFGLDLGQVVDFSALAVLERARRPDADRPGKLVSHFSVRSLKRWPLGTPYTQIVADLAKYLADPILDNPVLAADQTGVGMAVIDLIRAAKLPARLEPVVITGGHAITRDERQAWHCPKKELASLLQVLFQHRRVAIANFPERELLVRELRSFTARITSTGNEDYSSWREKDHDDLVLAVALAAWVAERPRPSLSDWFDRD
jgi:hypothetical protein